MKFINNRFYAEQETIFTKRILEDHFNI